MSTNTTMKAGQEKRSNVKMMAQIGMLAAISTVLMFFEFPLPFAPSFYELDFSEVPVLVGCFSMGPAAGVVIEFLKILLKFALKGTMTAGVGEVANFAIGCSLVLPAAWIYKRKKTRKQAVWGMVAGTICMAIVGGLLNAFVLLPTYAKAFGMPMEALIEMGSKVNGKITGLSTFILLAVTPFNLFKGVIISTIVLLIYKKISPILRMR
ncbi:ECF transporter S component [Clostridiaceae bacterium 68-1-5]|uniref:Riboflavin transporter n=1 Tax=Suipraeoptans intestinalis TaxID=2606628 RepID=A0A6N7USY8_9FIRM|nr:ECF transporter S component [Suipraeoptans intestinalis]MSR94383.1 ECF transporter S component [Suipraeoptans intestinalis]